MPKKANCPKCGKECDLRGMPDHLIKKHDLTYSAAKALCKDADSWPDHGKNLGVPHGPKPEPVSDPPAPAPSKPEPKDHRTKPEPKPQAVAEKKREGTNGTGKPKTKPGFFERSRRFWEIW